MGRCYQKLAAVAAVLMLGPGLVSGCTSAKWTASKETGPRVVKIGLGVPLTGDHAIYGQ
jgi:hypothetical protein